MWYVEKRYRNIIRLIGSWWRSTVLSDPAYLGQCCYKNFGFIGSEQCDLWYRTKNQGVDWKLDFYMWVQFMKNFTFSVLKTVLQLVLARIASGLRTGVLNSRLRIYFIFFIYYFQIVQVKGRYVSLCPSFGKDYKIMSIKHSSL